MDNNACTDPVEVAFIGNLYSLFVPSTQNFVQSDQIV